MDKKVLVISHNCFSKNSNIGRTLASYFCNYNPNNLAQLYFHDETPNSSVCLNYYNFTDTDALKSIFARWRKGKVFNKGNIDLDRKDSRNYSSSTARIYEYGRKRKPFVSYLRDLMWRLSSWNNRHFKKWLYNFGPDLILLTASDYSFPYVIANKIKKMTKIPMIIVCYDDFFLNYQHQGEFFRNIFYRHFLKCANKAIKTSSATFANNPKMSKDYENFFGREWPVLYMSADYIATSISYDISKRKGICYLGNLGYNRNLQLVEIGKYLKNNKLGFLPKHIDVYSNEKNKETIGVLNEENGIVFHGSIAKDEVQKIVNNSIAVLHVESFDDKNRNLVKYSFSTKIADCLGSGTPLIAFGPGDIASIEYLIDNDCAFIAENNDELESVFNCLLEKNVVNKVLYNALTIARRNHNRECITSGLYNVLNSIVGKYGDTN